MLVKYGSWTSRLPNASFVTRRVPVICTYSSGWPPAARAQFGVPLNHTDPKLEPAAVRELVAQYCRLDYAGARLNPAEWVEAGASGRVARQSRFPTVHADLAI